MQLLNGCRIVPFDTSHELKLIRETFTDDNFSGRDCFDRSSLSQTTAVDIDIDIKEVEIREINTGGGSLPAETAAKMIELEAKNIPGDSPEIEMLYSEMESVFGRLTANHQSLHHWNLTWANVVPGQALPFEHDSYRSMDLATRAQVDAASAQLILQALVSYTLPMLYGLLGSGVYVIRNLSREVANITFTKELLWQSLLRLAMGPMAGVAIGLLIVPEVAGGGAGGFDQLGILATLSPLALAFIAGYGIELLFALLDRIINAFVDGRE